MTRNELLFYNEYEQFYAMAAQSQAFHKFCRDACGQDFSQDGFSDIAQVDMILQHIPSGDDVHILDIGCGNGKMLGYLQERTGAFIHGFDFSSSAISHAQRLHPIRSDFRVGVMGQTEYPANSFDVIISMDTMYFAPDMTAFVGQIRSWLKADGVFFAGYQEGDVVPRTQDAERSLLAGALRANGMDYQVTDITRQTFELLKKKRGAALAHKDEFIAEGNGMWFDMLMLQTECAQREYHEFAAEMARYIFTAVK
ncbi:MAG: class I SAM-dependent methyltransferase [Ruminococcaceae bacterium]|nr:class I SAM-dependent methyltransferase [Oscillospiraceae bacterium]